MEFWTAHGYSLTNFEISESVFKCMLTFTSLKSEIAYSVTSTLYFNTSQHPRSYPTDWHGPASGPDVTAQLSFFERLLLKAAKNQNTK